MLHQTGGWVERDTCYLFADYAALLVKRLGDRVKYWTTFNEPGVVATDGYLAGAHAPGLQSPKTAYQVAHHLLVAHGLAIQALRAINPTLQLGIVLNQWTAEPASDNPADLVAARQFWDRHESFYLDALIKAHYPQNAWEMVVGEEPTIQAGDMAIIAQKLDYLGLNFYSRNLVSASGRITQVPGAEYTEMGWEVCPPALRRLLNQLYQDYNLPPIYITENGAAFKDIVNPDGSINDLRRLDYIRQHLIQTRLAMQDGVDVRGYFVWSLLDNFEWAHGYTKRFGIVHVDFQTQKRTIKDSGAWYAKVIANNALE